MKTLEQYTSLPYPMEIIPDEGGFVALIPDLPGCMSSGTTIDEAIKGLDDAKQLWIEGKLEDKQAIPEPTDLTEYSGKFVLRIPKTLHRSLDREARLQGTSLNQYVLHILSERHYFVAIEDVVKSALRKVAAEQLRGAVNLAYCNWERPHYRYVGSFLAEGKGDEDLLDNLYYVMGRPAASMVLHKNLSNKALDWELGASDIPPNRRLEGHE